MKIKIETVLLGKTALVIAALLQFSALRASAGESPYTATGWVIGVPVPGIWCTNDLGQIGIHGNVHQARVESSDPRLTGRRTIFVDGAAQADGSTLMYGAAYHEVGTWDATGTDFTATGGMWDTSYRGTMGADGSLQLHIVGTGWGGLIDGLRVDETLTRDPGAILDPAIPYHYTGTIKSAPFSTNMVVDDFSAPAGSWIYYGTGQEGVNYSYLQSGGQLVVSGHWPGVVTKETDDSSIFGVRNITAWSLLDGQTLEGRVDLVELNDDSTAAIFEVGTTSGMYSLDIGHGLVRVNKAFGSMPFGPAVFFAEKVQLPDTNVVLSLALTRVNANVVVTARVLDKRDGSVLYGRSIVDTPLADPTLTAAEFKAISGQDLVMYPDRPGAPFTSARPGVGVFQYNDGSDTTAVATFDNLELRKYEVPPLTITRAVSVTWPATPGYSVEGAPTLNGPWTPVQNSPPPGMDQVTLPANSPAELFRVMPAP